MRERAKAREIKIDQDTLRSASVCGLSLELHRACDESVPISVSVCAHRAAPMMYDIPQRILVNFVGLVRSVRVSVFRFQAG